METLFVIFIVVLMVANLIGDIFYTHYKNKHIKLVEKQNELLWSALKEGYDISKELIKVNLKKDGGQSNE